MSDEAEEPADEEEFCCLRRQLKEEVEVDRFGLAVVVMVVTPPPGAGNTCWSHLVTWSHPRVGEEAANLLLFLVLMRLWTTPPDGDSSTLYPATAAVTMAAAEEGGLMGDVGEDIEEQSASPLPEEMLRGRLYNAEYD